MPQIDSDLNIDEILDSTNIAESLDDEVLATIGQTVVNEYLLDEESRAGWLEQSEKWTKLAIQVKETKNFPWPKAANIKYPLLTVAALQFSARSYPALLPTPNLVKTKVVGKDPTGEKTDAAVRISSHMNYQLLEEMEEWEDDMDKLLIMVPIIGCVFKKSYYCPIDRRNKSELCLPREVVIDYYASSLATARRITHVIEMSPNDIIERIRNDVYIDIEEDLEDTRRPEELLKRDKRAVAQSSTGITPPDEIEKKNLPRVLLEQHRYLDLDNDGYEEPYVVTVDLQSKKVARIVARFDAENVKKNKKEEVAKIKPNCYFTKYGFIPNPDGSIYDMGFGLLQGPLNESANTLINQLLDAGTLQNTGAGLISKGLRIKQGVLRFKPGEFQVVNATPEMIHKGIYTLPTPQPSAVSFNLLNLILSASEKLSSTTELLLGESPGQNQPATTTLALLEQGQKVFTAIHKRLRKALKSELKKLARLNRLYLPAESYFSIIDYNPQQEEMGQSNQILRSDYELYDIHLIPTANPNVVSETQKMIKAQSLLEKAQILGLNVQEVRKRVLEAEDHEDIEALLQPNPPPPESLEEVAFRHQVEKDLDELEMKQKESIAKVTKDMSIAFSNEVSAQNDMIMSNLTELREGLRFLYETAEKQLEEGETKNESTTPGTGEETSEPGL